MHFHLQALCHNCNRLSTFTTPIANLLVLADMCRHCGWNDMVGWEGDRVCTQCQRMWTMDVERERASLRNEQ